jgi:predicted SAM-dependent methyltransferase
MSVVRGFARPILRAINRPVASARFRRLARSRSPLLIHVGAGPVRLDGWVNTDIGVRTAHWLDIAKPWPVSPGSVSRIYADSVLDMITLRDARCFFHHALRALEPGGRIRLATPDAEAISTLYLSDSPLAEAHLDRHRAVGYADVEHRVDIIRLGFRANGTPHGYLYDFVALARELSATGFVGVIRGISGKSDDPVFDGLESRVGETMVATTLIVEADAPGLD